MCPMGSVIVYGTDESTGQPVKLICNSEGKLIIDPSEILEDDPTDGEVAKAPTSNWAYDHENDPDAHGVHFSSGAYTGNNTVNRAIPHGLGAAPKAVFLSEVTLHFLARIITGSSVIIYSGASYPVTNPDATNFYVGNAANYDYSGNGTDKVYYWVAVV